MDKLRWLGRLGFGLVLLASACAGPVNSPPADTGFDGGLASTPTAEPEVSATLGVAEAVESKPVTNAPTEAILAPDEISDTPGEIDITPGLTGVSPRETESTPTAMPTATAQAQLEGQGSDQAEADQLPSEQQLKLLAQLESLGAAPELHNQVWLNSETLSLADLGGQVVLVEFWTFG